MSPETARKLSCRPEDKAAIVEVAKSRDWSQATAVAKAAELLRRKYLPKRDRREHAA